MLPIVQVVEGTDLIEDLDEEIEREVSTET